MRPERWIYTVPLRLRSLFRRRRVDDELDAELRDHLEQKMEENIAKGMTREGARRAAQLEMGGIEKRKEECRETRRVNWIQDLFQDLRYGLRTLRKSPGFTAVAILTLALGIGANTAIFSLIDAVMLQALPVQNPQQLVLLDWTSGAWPADVVKSLSGSWYKDKSGRATSTSFPYAVYNDLCCRNQNQTFSSLTAFAGNGSQLNVGYNGVAGRADGELVAGTFFSTLGIQPMLGRLFTMDDDRLGASPAAVVSYVYWEQRFGGDPRVVGKTITINSVPFTIVGVSPPGFFGVEPGRSVDVWVPLHSQPQVEPQWSAVPPVSGRPSAPNPNLLFEARDDWWVVMIGRLRPAVDQQQARAALEVTLQQSIAAQLKQATQSQAIPQIGLESGSKGLDYLRKEFSKPLFILMAVVGLVLLIACANVANLLLARGRSRQREISVRLALGAGRGRLIRQLLTEGLLLVALGGAASMLLAFWGTNILLAFMASGRWPISLNVSPNLRVFGFAAALSVLSGILFGLSPALRSTRVDLTPALKENPGDLSRGGLGTPRMRLGLAEGLVVTQVSLSFVLLVGAALFARTLASLQNVNLGFNEHNLLLFSIDPTQDGYTGQRLVSFYQELTRRLESLPAVRSVSLSHSTLIGGGGNWQVLRIGLYVPKSGEEVGAAVNWIGPNFFETLGVPAVLGRSVTQGDTESAPRVVVVNEQFVRHFFGGKNPLGRRIGLGDKGPQDVEIVGVVADTKYFDVRQDAPETIYLPWQQYPDLNGAMNFEVRTLQNPMDLAAAVRQVAQEMDRNLALYDVRSQMDQIDKTLFQERLFARLTSFFGVLAMLLACVGIYGVMGFVVTRRTREIGIRIALGASRGEIAGMILRQTLALVAIGLIVGIIVALGASRLVSSMLYGIKPDNPLTIAVAALLMAGAALLAAYFPTRRAIRVDPIVALRHE